MTKALLVLLLALLCSCSFIDEDSSEHEKAKLPDIVLIDTSYTLGQSGENPVYIASDRMELWSSEDRAETGRISFYQLDENGEVSLSGRADRAEIDTETKVIRLSGNVLFLKSGSDMRIEAEELVFDSEGEELSAEGTVSVSSEDGTFVGSGFTADLVSSTYAFKAITKGVFAL